jgi:branched-chain amino acid transport system permease protein
MVVGLPIQEILTGLSIGSRLFLVALGLSLIFGVLGVLNFAHGAFYMIGAYVTASLIGSVGGNFWLAAIGAAIVVGAIGAGVEMGLVRRVYDRDELDQLILTFALVLIISDLTRTVWGSGTQTVETPPALAGTLPILGVDFPAYRLFVVVVAFLAMGVFWYVLKRTYFGQLVRATSSDRDMAALLGVNVPRLYTGVFAVGSFLAGLGGALTTPMQSFTPALGDQVIINAFVIVVIGGLGSFTGAFVGAMIIGLFQSFGVLIATGVNQLLPFLAMILVLMVRPEGLFGGERA